MLKQKARAIALGVLAGDLALTAISLPVAYVIRHGVLTTLSPTLFPDPAPPVRPVPLPPRADPSVLGRDALRGGLLPKPPDAAARRGDLGGDEGGLRRDGDPRARRLRPAARLREPLAPRRFRRGELRVPRDGEGRAAARLAVGPRARLQLPHRAARRARGRRRRSSRTSSRRTRTGDSACSAISTTTTAARSAAPTGGRASARSRISSPCSQREVVDELVFVIEKGKLGAYEEALLVGGAARRAGARLARHLPARARAAGARGARRRAASLVHDDAVESGAARRQARDRPRPVALLSSC